MPNNYAKPADLTVTNGLITAVGTTVDAIRAVDVPAINTHLTDIKGTGFVKATHALIWIRTIVADQQGKVANIETIANKLNPLLPLNGTIETIQMAGAVWVTVSETLLHSNDAEKSTTADAYEKQKEIIIPFNGTYRIKWDMKYSITSPAKGKIYKNGVALGGEKTSNSLTYEPFENDLPFVVGDTLELWTYAPSGAPSVQVRNLRLHGTWNGGFKNIL